MTAKGTRRPRARAAIMPMVACSMMLLAAVMSLAVDLSAQYRARARIDQTLELSKDATMANLNAVKFADDPAAAAWGVVREALTQDKCQGTATFYYFELPESETGSTDRVAGMMLEVTDSTGATFSHLLGYTSNETRSALAWAANPYSDTTVWRPAGVTNRAYTLDCSSGQVSAETLTSRDELPERLQSEINRALRQLGQ